LVCNEHKFHSNNRGELYMMIDKNIIEKIAPYICEDCCALDEECNKEECRYVKEAVVDAVRKQIPKKPVVQISKGIVGSVRMLYCPTCDAYLPKSNVNKSNGRPITYCWYCGQKLDLEDCDE